MPVTCCMLHRLGSGFGQNGSTLKSGAPFSPVDWTFACGAAPVAVNRRLNPSTVNSDSLAMIPPARFENGRSRAQPRNAPHARSAGKKILPPSEAEPHASSIRGGAPLAVGRYFNHETHLCG